MAVLNDENGRCSPDGNGSCALMRRAVGMTDPKATTGIVMSFFPPHAVAIRCRGEGKGRFVELFLRLCPWCGEELPKGKP
jgi:hypothetical protein